LFSGHGAVFLSSDRFLQLEAAVFDSETFSQSAEAFPGKFACFLIVIVVFSEKKPSGTLKKCRLAMRKSFFSLRESPNTLLKQPTTLGKLFSQCTLASGTLRKRFSSSL
jgi:hypothetical protein